MKTINVGIIGVGNCASSLVQGRFYYEHAAAGDYVPGLITTDFGGYLPKHINFVTAFDVDERKVGLDLSQAIFAPPNCTKIFKKDLPLLACPVTPGYVIDSVAPHMMNYQENRRIKAIANVYHSQEVAKAAIVKELKEKNTQVIVNFLPVGSEKNVLFYADCALEAGCAFVNAMPVFVSKVWGHRFLEKGLPVLGDDIKSQVGATIVHRMLTKLFQDRGHLIDNTYQLNFGGNTDFMNMLDQARLTSKKISKTQSVVSQMDHQKIGDDDIHVGPSDYVPFLNDNKICFIRINARQFGDVPMELEVKLSVEDSPNSAGVITDAIRAAKLALNKKLAGPIVEASSYLFKSPTVQYDDFTAKRMIFDFIRKYGLTETETRAKTTARPAVDKTARPVNNV